MSNPLVSSHHHHHLHPYSPQMYAGMLICLYAGMLVSSSASILASDVCWFHEGEPLRVDGTQSISTQYASKSKSSVQVLQPTPSKHQILLHQVHNIVDAFDQTDQ